MNKIRRKLVLSTWRPPKEGNIYGKLTINVDKALRYLAYVQEKTGKKLTITHFAGRAVAEAMHRTPAINGFIRLGAFVPHKSVDISLLVALDGGNNLANVKIRDAHTKTLVEFAGELRAFAKKLRSGKDEEFEKSQSTVRLLPTWLIRPMLWFVGWMTSSLGISMKLLGLEAFPFGSCMITSVGMFGLDEAFAPHTPFARVPIIVLLGSIHKEPIVEDDKIVVRSRMTITATIDHRYIDGSQGANLAKTVREAFEEPWRMDGLEEAPSDFQPEMDIS